MQPEDLPEVWNEDDERVTLFKGGIAMPGGDATGPMGMGPMTGRAAGYCAGYPVPGYMNPVPGRGFGMGFGRGRGFWGRGGGRGWRNMFYATGLPGWMRAGTGVPAFGGGFPAMPVASAMSKEQQVEALKGEAEFLEGQLDAIKKRIEEISAPEAAKI